MTERPNVKEALRIQWRLMNPSPPFVPGGSLFDRSKYTGRLRHLFQLIDPRFIFVSDAEILSSQEKIKKFKNLSDGEIAEETDRELWRAQRLVDVGIHPETQSLIPRLGRMAWFIPCNIPIAVGMLTMHSAPATVLWQFVNQSYNAFFNFSNSASGSFDYEKSRNAYFLATAGACSVALGLRRLRGFQSMPWLVPYMAVASAGSLNAYAMRRDETVNGVNIRDSVSGEILGKSAIAGKIALGATIFTRSILLPLPLLGLPSVFMKFLNLGWHARRTPFFAVSAEVFCISAAVAFALPACVAALPQSLEIPSRFLEAEFRNGESVTVNRGV